MRKVAVVGNIKMELAFQVIKGFFKETQVDACFDEDEKVMSENLNDKVTFFYFAVNNEEIDKQIENISDKVDEYDIFLFLLDTETVAERLMASLSYKKHSDKIMILDPALLGNVKDDLLARADYIVLNEREIISFDSNYRNLESSLRRYPCRLLVTTESGYTVYFDEVCQKVEMVPSMAEDNTKSASDTDAVFGSAFAYALANDYELQEAVCFANVALGTVNFG